MYVPLNLMELTQNVKISGDTGCFKMKKIWQPNKKKGKDEDESTYPTVYFSFAISCGKDPGKLVKRMGFEWSRMDGQKLMMKDPPSFSTEIHVAVYHLHNMGHMPSLTSELTEILTQPLEIAIAKGMDDPYKGPVPLTG